MTDLTELERRLCENSLIHGMNEDDQDRIIKGSLTIFELPSTTGMKNLKIKYSSNKIRAKNIYIKRCPQSSMLP